MSLDKIEKEVKDFLSFDRFKLFGFLVLELMFLPFIYRFLFHPLFWMHLLYTYFVSCMAVTVINDNVRNLQEVIRKTIETIVVLYIVPPAFILTVVLIFHMIFTYA